MKIRLTQCCKCGETEVDGVHPLIFEGGRRPPTDWIVAGWTGVHPRPTPSTHLLSRKVDVVLPLFFFHLRPLPGREGREEVWWSATARWASTHFFFYTCSTGYSSHNTLSDIRLTRINAETAELSYSSSNALKDIPGLLDRLYRFVSPVSWGV